MATDMQAEVKQVVAPLQLGKQIAPSLSLGERIEALKAAVAHGAPADEVLSRALTLWSTTLGVSRLLVLVANPTRDELWIRFGLRDDIEALSKELRFPLSNPRVPTGLFSSIYHSGRDVVVADAFAPRTAAVAIPPRYYEILGSPAFALYGCKGPASAVVLLDVDSPDLLPTVERVAPLAPLRALIAQAASRPASRS